MITNLKTQPHLVENKWTTSGQDDSSLTPPENVTTLLPENALLGMKELTPQEKFEAEDPETMVPRALMAGRTVEAIVADLEQLDWSQTSARSLVARIANELRRYYESPESRLKLIKEARNELVGGILIALLGVCMTLLSILGAIGGALPFIVVTLGVIIGGLALASKGWNRRKLYRSSRFAPFSQPLSEPIDKAEQSVARRPA
jgi:hypothetical protein